MSKILGLLLLALPACANVPPSISAPPARDVYLQAPPARVWDALLVVFTDANVPIENMDRSSWFVRTQEMRLGPPSSRSVDCGIGAYGDTLANAAPVLVRYTALLRPAGDSTGVRLQTTARTVTPGSGELACVSRGTLEKHFLDLLRAGVSSPRP